MIATYDSYFTTFNENDRKGLAISSTTINPSKTIISVSNVAI